MQIIDSHAHLDDTQFTDDIGAVINRAKQNHVYHIISIGQDVTSSRNTVALADKYDSLFATVGIHPHEAKSYTNESIPILRELANNPKVVAIGEIGLDYHYDHSPRDIQKQVFRDFLKLAEETKLPVVIHCREAEVDTLSILGEFKNKVIGVMHCFSGNREMLNKSLELGYYISIAGPVTFKKATELQELVKFIPKDKLLIETDSPYLAPVPFRGKRNEPGYVLKVAEKIAELTNTSLDEIGLTTFQNTKRLFKLPVS